MEDTLGKRIIAHRKRLCMTQDKLAEQLGVTAQAVSKWENDQSCPDITLLPKLAEIFGISTDTLLGIAAQEKVYEAEVVTPGCREDNTGEDDEDDEDDGLHFLGNDWEFFWNNGRKSSIGMAVWILLVGGLLLAGNIYDLEYGFWDILWPTGLLTFGLFGILPKFSFFRLGCLLFGAYFLLGELDFLPFILDKGILIPVFLLLFGLSLLVDALRKPKKPHFTIVRNGDRIKKSSCNITNERFDCNLSFGEKDYVINTPRLQGGAVNVSFGELEIDLSGCQEIVSGCTIDASCSFGELTIKVPHRYRVEAASSTAFGNFEVDGSPSPDPDAVINLDANVSFGEICVEYI